MAPDVDVVVVGARCAGSAVATHLARRKCRVVMLDKAHFPSDTMSTHLMLPDGVHELALMGALEGVLRADPTISPYVSAHVDEVSVHQRFPSVGGIDYSVCVPRDQQDIALVDAARLAGVDVREGCQVEDLLWSGSRVTGVRYRHGTERHAVHARLVVGADGRRSTVAAAVGAWYPYRASADERVVLWRYVQDPLANDRLGATVSLWRQDDSVAVTFPSAPRGTLLVGFLPPTVDLPDWRKDLDGRWKAELAKYPDDGLAGRISGVTQQTRIRSSGELVSYFRASTGPGWALAGDAGHFKNPIIGRGMSDALHFSRRLAERIVDVLDDPIALDYQLREWERERDQRLLPTYHFANRECRSKPATPLVAEVTRTFCDFGGRSELMKAYTRLRTPERTIGPTRMIRGLLATARRPDVRPAELIQELGTELRCEIAIRRDRVASFRSPRVSATERGDWSFPNPPSRHTAPNGPSHLANRSSMSKTSALRYVDPYRHRSTFYYAFANFATSRVGQWVAVNFAWKVDPHLMRWTRSRFGVSGLLPNALLETRGARSGLVRRNSLIYFHDGDKPTVVASKLGAPDNPAWYHNLRKNPDVVFGGVPFRAEPVTDEVERERLWALGQRVYPGYAALRERAAAAGRAIPIIQLHPR